MPAQATLDQHPLGQAWLKDLHAHIAGRDAKSPVVALDALVKTGTAWGLDFLVPPTPLPGLQHPNLADIRSPEGILQRRAADCRGMSLLTMATLDHLGWNAVMFQGPRHVLPGILLPMPTVGPLRGIPLGTKQSPGPFLFPLEATSFGDEKTTLATVHAEGREYVLANLHRPGTRIFDRNGRIIWRHHAPGGLVFGAPFPVSRGSRGVRDQQDVSKPQAIAPAAAPGHAAPSEVAAFGPDSSLSPRNRALLRALDGGSPPSAKEHGALSPEEKIDLAEVLVVAALDGPHRAAARDTLLQSAATLLGKLPSALATAPRLAALRQLLEARHLPFATCVGGPDPAAAGLLDPDDAVWALRRLDLCRWETTADPSPEQRTPRLRAWALHLYERLQQRSLWQDSLSAVEARFRLARLALEVDHGEISCQQLSRQHGSRNYLARHTLLDHQIGCSDDPFSSKKAQTMVAGLAARGVTLGESLRGIESDEPDDLPLVTTAHVIDAVGRGDHAPGQEQALRAVLADPQSGTLDANAARLGPVLERAGFATLALEAMPPHPSNGRAGLHLDLWHDRAERRPGLELTFDNRQCLAFAVMGLRLFYNLRSETQWTRNKLANLTHDLLASTGEGNEVDYSLTNLERSGWRFLRVNQTNHTPLVNSMQQILTSGHPLLLFGVLTPRAADDSRATDVATLHATLVTGFDDASQSFLVTDVGWPTGASRIRYDQLMQSDVLVALPWHPEGLGTLPDAVAGHVVASDLSGGFATTMLETGQRWLRQVRPVRIER